VKKTPPPSNPNDRRNLSGVQFRYSPPQKEGFNFHEIQAIAPEAERKRLGGKGIVVGTLQWHARTGEVNYVRTYQSYRGLGVATTLWDKANKLSADTGIKAPQHSKHRTDQGDAWAKSVGGVTPSRAPYQEW
jgi:hypothetical protein